MNLFYTDQDGNVTGPIPRESLLRIAESGALPPNTQVCIEGTEGWRPLAEAFPNLPGASKVALLLPAMKTGITLTYLALGFALLSLIVSSAAAAKVFWRHSSVKSNPLKTPQQAIDTYIRLAKTGSWEEIRDLQQRQAVSQGSWTYSLLDQKNVQLEKTLEVTGSGDEEKNGRIICFLTLKCPDGVTRYETAVFAKDKEGSFWSSSYPGYISDDELTPDDQRLKELIKRWETTGELSN